MQKELFIASSPHETKVAVLESDSLVEVYYERGTQTGLVGGIYKGRVSRVLPGMQSAFVDIGLDRDAFLYVSDFFEDNEEYDEVVSGVEDRVLRLEKGVPAGIISSPIDLATATKLDPVRAEEQASAAAPASAPVERPAGGPPAGGHPDRDGRDRRGRRPRRRRGRGRGFPDSKYASPSASVEVRQDSAPVEREEAAETEEREEEDLPVLP